MTRTCGVDQRMWLDHLTSVVGFEAKREGIEGRQRRRASKACEGETVVSLGLTKVDIAPQSWIGIALNCAIVTSLVLCCFLRLTMSTQTVSDISSSPSSLGEIPENSLFDDPDADIVLRSCDHREFRVLKLYVIKASPVLRAAIQSALSSPTASTTPGPSLPSIQLSDSGATLSSLLSFILPMPSVLPSTIEETMLLLSAAQKYRMTFILGYIRAVIASQDPPFIRQETALQIYSLAQTHGLRYEAHRAARATLALSFTLEDLEDHLGVASLVDLHELWKFHHRVRTYLADDLTTFKTTGVPSEMTDQPCSYGTLNWLGEYVDSIAKSPVLFDITEFHMCLLRHTRASYHRCECANIPSRALRAFWMALTDVVHDCMTRVSIDIYEIYGEHSNCYQYHRLNQTSQLWEDFQPKLARVLLSRRTIHPCLITWIWLIPI